jgi:hypothetical protein
MSDTTISGSAFSWFVDVKIAAVVYFAISARDVRQPELKSGAAAAPSTTRPEGAQA